MLSTILLIIATLILLYCLIFTIGFILEKLPIRPFVLHPPGDVPKPAPYIVAMKQMVESKGFVERQDCRYVKSGIYQIDASMWFSPERSILALVCGGKMLRTRYRQSFLYSRTIHDTIILTTDSLAEDSLADIVDVELVQKGDFFELLDCQRKRLEAVAHILQLFDASTPLESLNEIETMVTRRLEHLGYARRRGAIGDYYKFTLKGAFCFFYEFHFRYLRSLWAQTHRLRLPPVGTSKRQVMLTPVEPVRFSAQTPHLFYFDPMALDGLLETLRGKQLPPEGPPHELIRQLNRELSVGYFRIPDFRPGAYELLPDRLDESCYDADDTVEKQIGQALVDSAALIIVDSAHLLALLEHLSWEVYDRHLQQAVGENAIFQGIMDRLGGPYFAAVDTGADGSFSLRPESLRPVD